MQLKALLYIFIAAPSDHCAYTYAIYIAEVKRAKQEDDVYIFAAVQGRARKNVLRKRLESPEQLQRCKHHFPAWLS